MKTYFLSDGNRKIGPFTAQDIRQMAFECRIPITDLVFNGETNDWVSVMDLADGGSAGRTGSRQKASATLLPLNAGLDTPVGLIGEGFNETAEMTRVPGPPGEGPVTSSIKLINQPLRIPPQPGLADHARSSGAWQLKEGGICLGPYSYAAILGLMMDGTLREHDLIRHVGEDTWRPALSFPELTLDYLKGVHAEPARKVVERGGFKRKSPRLDTQDTIGVSDGPAMKHVRMGDISVGGCSILPNCPMFKIGDSLFLSIFRKTESSELDFNARATVVQVVRQSDKYDEWYKHSLKFTTLHQDLLEEIKTRMVAG